MLWPGLPSPGVAAGLETVGLVLAVLVGIGWRTRMTSTVWFVWALVANSAVFALGKVDHSFIVWCAVPLLATAGWGDRISLDSRTEQPTRPTWPVGALSLLLAVGYLTAAIPKILSGWLDSSTHAVEGFFRSEYVSLGRDELLANLFWEIESPIFWELLDLATVGFELGVPLAVLHPKIFRGLLWVAALFHVSVLLIMNIPFTNMFFLYSALVAGPRSAQRARSVDIRFVIGAFSVAGASALAGVPLLRVVERAGWVPKATVSLAVFSVLIAMMVWFARTAQRDLAISGVEVEEPPIVAAAVDS